MALGYQVAFPGMSEHGGPDEDRPYDCEWRSHSYQSGDDVPFSGPSDHLPAHPLEAEDAYPAGEDHDLRGIEHPNCSLNFVPIQDEEQIYHQVPVVKTQMFVNHDGEWKLIEVNQPTEGDGNFQMTYMLADLSIILGEDL